MLITKDNRSIDLEDKIFVVYHKSYIKNYGGRKRQKFATDPKDVALYVMTVDTITKRTSYAGGADHRCFHETFALGAAYDMENELAAQIEDYSVYVADVVAYHGNSFGSLEEAKAALVELKENGFLIVEGEVCFDE